MVDVAQHHVVVVEDDVEDDVDDDIDVINEVDGVNDVDDVTGLGRLPIIPTEGQRGCSTY